MKGKKGVEKPVTYRGFGIRVHPRQQGDPFASIIDPTGYERGETEAVETREAAVRAAQRMIDRWLDSPGP